MFFEKYFIFCQREDLRLSKKEENYKLHKTHKTNKQPMNCCDDQGKKTQHTNTLGIDTRDLLG